MDWVYGNEIESVPNVDKFEEDETILILFIFNVFFYRIKIHKSCVSQSRKIPCTGPVSSNEGLDVKGIFKLDLFCVYEFIFLLFENI